MAVGAVERCCGKVGWPGPLGPRTVRLSPLWVSAGHGCCVRADGSSHFGAAAVNLSIFIVILK